MRLKAKNLLLLIMQAIASLLMFCPGVFTEELWVVTSIYGSSTLRGEELVSFMDKLSGCDSGRILGVLVLGCALVLLLIFTVQLTARKHTAVSALISLAQLALFLIYSLAFVEDPWTGGLVRYEYSVSFLFFVILAAMITVSITAIVSNHKIKQNGILPDEIVAPTVTASGTTASELKEYKELLDSGAITQEEFDAKKKQLLNL